MKKLFGLMLLMMLATSAFAQFKKDTKYVGASLTGLNMSVSDRKDFQFGIDLKGGYFIEDNWMIEGQFGWHTQKTYLKSCKIGAKVRYTQYENGLYYAGGLQYVHERKNFNDLQLTPEIGYCYYLNHYISVEPALYYDMSLTDLAHKSEFGLKVGIGIYF